MDKKLYDNYMDKKLYESTKGGLGHVVRICVCRLT